jgi:zinc-ribbon domain
MQIMKVFNGKAAAEEYMSNHTLTFSTPELTLTRFAFWLGDIVPDPKNPGQTIPRIMTLIEEKDFAPVPIIDDDTFVPTGAVKSVGGGIYGSIQTETGSTTKFCPECGFKLSLSAKFCTQCGANQD